MGPATKRSVLQVSLRMPMVQVVCRAEMTKGTRRPLVRPRAQSAQLDLLPPAAQM